MTDSVPTEIKVQLSLACTIIKRHLSPILQAIHLYGSAVDGGLKPHSDIDLLVTVSRRPEEAIRKALLQDLLTVSRCPGKDKTLRALEVTVIVYNEVVPWRYPAVRELQFGEWLRKDILAGVFEPAVKDIDLAILLTKARQHSLPLVGPTAEEFFEPVPERDFFKALSDTLNQWKSPEDWIGDERNVILTLARIWYSAATGNILSKDAAADWVLKRLPIEYQPLLYNARQGYLGNSEDQLTPGADQITEFVLFLKSAIGHLLKIRNS